MVTMTIATSADSAKKQNGGDMNNLHTDSAHIQEALDLLQEECGEVIVEVSKCRRFGLYTAHYKTGNSHIQELGIEVADVLALVDILIEQGALSRETLDLAKEAKKQKLKLWTDLYE